MDTKVLLLSPERDGSSAEAWEPLEHVDEVRRFIQDRDHGFRLIGPSEPINMNTAGAEILGCVDEIDERTAIYIDGHSGLWEPPVDRRCWVGGEWDEREDRVRGGAFLPADFDPSTAVSPGVIVIGGCRAGAEGRIEQFFRIVTPGTPVVASARATCGADARRLILKHVLKPFAAGKFDPETFSSTIPRYQASWRCVVARAPEALATAGEHDERYR